MPKLHRFLLATLIVPAAASAQTIENPAASQTYQAIQSTVKQQVAPSGPNAGKPQYYTNQARATSTVRFDKATNSYIVRDTGSASAISSFGPSNLVPGESSASYKVYRKTVNGSTETFTMLVPGAGNPTIQLSYATFAHWRKVTPNGGFNGATAQSDTYLVYGFKTAKGQVPVSGTATYSTILDGTYSDPNRSYNVDGTGSVTANFGTGGLSFSATATGTPQSGPVLAFGTINGAGTINSNNSSFAANGSNGTYRMDMSGYFYGPGADEIGATFALTGPKGNGNGAMVGD